MVFLPIHGLLQGTFQSNFWSCLHLIKMPLGSAHNLPGIFPHLFHPNLSDRDTILDSIHTVQTETLHSRIFWSTKVRWTGVEDRQTSGSSARRRFWRAGGWGAEQLTWLQIDLYLSPSLFKIFSSCLWLKLDTPMDLASPASLHFSRAWEGEVVNNYVEQ